MRGDLTDLPDLPDLEIQKRFCEQIPKTHLQLQLALTWHCCGAAEDPSPSQTAAELWLKMIDLQNGGLRQAFEDKNVDADSLTNGAIPSPSADCTLIVGRLAPKC